MRKLGTVLGNMPKTTKPSSSWDRAEYKPIGSWISTVALASIAALKNQWLKPTIYYYFSQFCGTTGLNEGSHLGPLKQLSSDGSWGWSQMQTWLGRSSEISSLTSLAPLQGWLGLRGAGCPSLSLSPPSLSMWIAWAFSQHHALKTVGFLTWQLASTCVRNPRNPRKSWKVSILLNLEGHVASLLHILLVKSKSQGPPSFTGRGIHRV